MIYRRFYTARWKIYWNIDAPARNGPYSLPKKTLSPFNFFVAISVPLTVPFLAPKIKR